MTAAKPRILAIHAHPDDVEFQCAGTLCLLAQLGHEITIATMTPGDCGSKTLSPEEISAVRRNEARKAAGMIGADYVCLEFRDLSIVVDNDAKRRVTEAVRRVRPGIVLTAPPVDYMDDHEVTSHLVRDACFNASCPNYMTRQWEPAAATDHIPFLYYVDPIEGVDPFGQSVPVDSMSTCHRFSPRSSRCWPVTPASGNGCGHSMAWTSTCKAKNGGVPGAAAKSA